MEKSIKFFNEAKNYISGGVNSPVRSFQGVDGSPIYFDYGKGPYLYDVDGKEYIDYVGSWGPMILGHANKSVINSIKKIVDKGLSFGAPTEIETELAKKICKLIPSIDLVRMVSSGTEATMSAIRLVRGYTNRDKIVKFTGCYHGHSDSLLVKAGSGALTLGVPSSPGVPKSLAKHTITLEYNDIESVKSLFIEIGEQIACIIVEPVAGNMGCVLPKAGFLKTLREVCDKSGAILIFDEVMTGFRVDLGGAQKYYNVAPDITTLGKIIGGGMPLAAFGGKSKIMQEIAPTGPIYQAGTLSGNPISISAGIAMLNEIEKDKNFYQKLTANNQYLTQGIIDVAKKHNISMTANAVGGMFGFFFSNEKEIVNFSQVANCNIDMFKKFHKLMLIEGIYLAPSAYEAGFLSISHSKKELDKTIDAANKAFSKC